MGSIVLNVELFIRLRSIRQESPRRAKALRMYRMVKSVNQKSGLNLNNILHGSISLENV